jgi:hypothetical protein
LQNYCLEASDLVIMDGAAIATITTALIVQENGMAAILRRIVAQKPRRCLR